MFKTGFGYNVTETPTMLPQEVLGDDFGNNSELAGEFVVFAEPGSKGSLDTSFGQPDDADFDGCFEESSFDVDLSGILGTSGANDTEMSGEFIVF